MGGYSLTEINWLWGTSLIAGTSAIHALGVVIMAFAGIRVQRWLGRRHLGTGAVIFVLVFIIAVVGILLALLHGAEAAIWALAYLHLGALNSFSDALFYSLDSMTTRGASGLPLDPHWRLLGAVEAMNGSLLFGISTAYLFAVMHAYWPMMTRADAEKHGTAAGSRE